MSLFAIILLVALIVYPFVRYTAFIISNWHAGCLGEIEQRLGGLRKPVLRGVLTALMADIYVLPTYILGWLLPLKHEGQGTPIILVHGLFHNSSAWIVMLHRLKKAGLTNIHTYQYDSFFKTFDPAVQGLEQKIDQLLAPNSDSKVILIGHSLGGLVCRKAAGNPNYRDRIAGLVALGSPHNGSDLALFGGNRMSRGLIPGHSIPKSVAATPDPNCPRLAIYNLVDDFVFPLNMLQPNRDGWQETICSPMGHVWMLLSNEVFILTLNFIKKIESSK